MLNTQNTTTIRNVLVEANEKLPDHVFNHLLCFFNGTPSVLAIQKHKELVRHNLQTKINGLIKQATSRKNMFPLQFQYGEEYEEEHWAFGFDIDDEKLQLQACNCKKCGNYNYLLPFEHTNRILCNC
jgi:hypothetical protein